LLTTIVYWAGIIYTDFKLLSKISFYGTVAANGLIFILLSVRWLNYGYFPLSNLYESLLFLAWGITFTTIVLEYQTRTPIIGSISNPITLFITGFAGLSLPENMQAPSPLVPALKSNWLMMHVTVMMLSYASLIVGSLLGIFFLILANGKKDEVLLQGNSYGNNFNSSKLADTAFYKQEADEEYTTLILEDSTSTNSNRLTLLESLDNLSYRTISFGFPLLTIGIIAGAVWANEAWGSYWSWDPKETWALITWLVFASYLHARISRSWQGKKPAMIASVGFIVVWICYLGVNFLGKGLHTYGQIL
jgi:cytochrome c-type biogenesis protein CcsB